MEFKDLSFEVSDALVGEAQVRPGAFKAFLQRAGFPGELLDAALERDVLGGQRLNRLPGNHLVEVTELPHQLADLMPLREDLLLRAAEFGLRVQRTFAPGRFDLLVLGLGCSDLSESASSRSPKPSRGRCHVG
ncbi:hypothetical protein OG568_52490 (plasmid) [Streptomyces sp. NBC_01450]|uniref:hypothetical protein n=1 Tax=Streptomyces sp. NBC_01450 TaxID=2903871 RepID=UPI002E346208|nr:hypothetical protein [Streptomyces sp. NBC_01450]